MAHVTTLLRASRDADEELLDNVLKEIAEFGMNREDLNAVDCSGRVSKYIKYLL